MLEAVMTYAPIFPEVVLALGGMMLLLLGTLNNEDTGEAVTWGAMALMAVAAVLVALQPVAEPVRLFDGAFTMDGFARFVKVLVLVGAIVTLLMSIGELKRLGELQFEYPVLITFATLGMLVMVSASDLITLYLGLEIQSLALYVCAALRRDSVRSSEAGLKYFVLGALSSGMLLYGASLIYGYTGSTTFTEIAKTLQAGTPSLGLIFGLVFLLAGFAFKISAVPFHMWTPDVYEGAPTPITAFFAGAPKVAAMALLTRVVITAFPAILTQWQQIIVFISIASMVLGAFAAIGQTNIKRLMAYSSIGHMGYALVGLAAGTAVGVQGVLIYLTIYVLTTLGVFACIMAMQRSEGAVEEIDQLAGLSETNLPMAVALMILFFSLAGIPPVAGFFAKFFVFAPAINAGLYPLAIVGVLASVVGAYYYLRVIKIMFFDPPEDSFEPMPRALGSVITVSAVLVAFFALPLIPLWDVAEAAAKSLF